ncbi:macro domain-containing protein [Acetobacter pasteurianus]|uniref:macro domain-containing protein n=1 Tax=Acetobacter TaxID=434 RepID=UPI0038CD9590
MGRDFGSGKGGSVSMAVIGGGQARLSSVMPAQDAIRFTLLSFMFASRKNRICDELRIVVRP